MTHPPADRYERHRLAVAQLTDDELMTTLMKLDPLPDVDDLDPAWKDDANFERAELLLAIAESMGERRLVRAIGPVYERAALGDVFEMLRWMRHGAEQAVAPDWGTLTRIMRPLVNHARAGTRRWAVQELGVLRDPAALPEILASIDDAEPIVRREACTSLGLVAPKLDEDERATARARLERVRDLDPVDDVKVAARDALR